MESIRIWLNGSRLYSTGVALYDLYGDNPLLKRLFAEPGSSSFKINKLNTALEQLYAASNKNEKFPVLQKEAIAGTFILPEKSDRLPPEKRWKKQRDAVEEALYQQWFPLFAELMNLCSRVGDFAMDGQKDPLKKIEAGRMVLRICDLDDKLDDIYEQRDVYKESGQLPDQRPYGEPCVDPILMPKKLANAERYVREFKKKLEKDPSNLYAAETLKKHEWFVTFYKKELKMN